MTSKKILPILAITVAIVGLFILCLALAQIATQDNSSLFKRDSIGIIEIEGMILDSEETNKQIEYLKVNTHVKAVVLRVNSPGGVVGPTQEIYEEIEKLNKVKPVIVSMGSIATSGGYYVSAPTTKIFANPGTVTGSIGVLMKMSNIEDLLDKIGIKSYVLKSGEFKDTGSLVRPLSPQDKEILQSIIDNMYEQFVTAVAKGRKLPLQEVKKWADGRILTGEQALQIKLVDRLGNLQDAIDEATKIAGFTYKPKIVYPPKPDKSIFDLFVNSAGESLVKAIGSDPRFFERFEFSQTVQ